LTQTGGLSQTVASTCFDIRPVATMPADISVRPASVIPQLSNFSNTFDSEVIALSADALDYGWSEEVAAVPETSTSLAALFASAALACRFRRRKPRNCQPPLANRLP